MLSIAIDRRLSRPVYQQVADQLREHIASGTLAPGKVLPSVRQLAGDLGVNLNTIARAYRVLQSEGFLVIRDRAGVVVAAAATEIDHSATARIFDEIRPSLARLRQAGMTTDALLRALGHEVAALDGGEKEND